MLSMVLPGCSEKHLLLELMLLNLYHARYSTMIGTHGTLIDTKEQKRLLVGTACGGDLSLDDHVYHLNHPTKRCSLSNQFLFLFNRVK
ncbi:hypothetical protein ALCH109712_12355 [Alkalicoccus chagannorensis]